VDSENILLVMTESADDVSRIHKRYTLTTFTPTSHYVSLAISIAVACVIAAVSYIDYFKSTDNLIMAIPITVGALVTTQFLDPKILRTDYSKSIHMSAFGTLLWLVTILCGILSSYVFSKPQLLPIYITEGMLLFASFRIAIFTSVLGARLKTAWIVCLLQPLAMFLAFVPVNQWVPMLSNPRAIEYGIVFCVLGSIWTLLSDRIAGNGKLTSTHAFLQAYLAAWTNNNPGPMESLMEKRSESSKVSTFQILFKTKNQDCRLVIPDLHPGPFHPIGGSNIPYLIYKNLDSSAMVMHSISDHSLNLPSKSQVDLYITSLKRNSTVQQGSKSTKPVTIQVNKARTTGLLFDKTAVLILSLSPYGMEDVPFYIKSDLEQYGMNRGYERVLIVDSHNAMGKEIEKLDADDLLNAAKSTLDTLITKETLPMEIGYANSENLDFNADDLGPGKVAIMCLKIGDEKFFLAWADANNMLNGLREDIANHFSKNGYNFLEICTSDTHYKARTAKNKHGYFEFGSLSKSTDVISWFMDLAKKAEQTTTVSSYDLLQSETNVKVMGGNQLEIYSKSLDNAMRITQAFLLITTGFFIYTLL
jgi:putative membrane protein